MQVMWWLQALAQRNSGLFWFGILCLGGGLLCMYLAGTSTVQVNGISAWIKPMKFFLRIWICCWTMGWLLHELNQPVAVRSYSIMVVIVMSIELGIITWQAAYGRLSHFNTSTVLYSSLFTIMGIAISLLTVWTFIIGLKFWGPAVADLPAGYLWGIRLGIIFFVIFSFEGGMMGARLAHTVGAADGGAGIPVLNWSKAHGDLRIAHFFGIHALQLLPLAGYFITRTTTSSILFSMIYFVLVSYLLLRALRGLPLPKFSS